MHCMFVSPSNSYAEILIPDVMVYGVGAFEKKLGHEGRGHENCHIAHGDRLRPQPCREPESVL